MTDHVSRVGGRFAGEVPGVEFLEGGVDVVEVERDDRATIRSSASISTMPSTLGAELARAAGRGSKARHERGQGAPRGSQ